MMNRISSVLLTAGTLGLFSCGGDMPQGTRTPSAAESATLALRTNIDLEAGDDMKFSETTFAVPAGQEVTLTLKHTGKMSKEMMGHNVVVLKPGEDVKEYGNEAMKAKAEDYVPEALADKVVAHTEMIGGGASTTINFSIATPGEYPFLCSFPGHYPIMKGIIIVK